jgi:hypothetical protein
VAVENIAVTKPAPEATAETEAMPVEAAPVPEDVPAEASPAVNGEGANHAG